MHGNIPTFDSKVQRRGLDTRKGSQSAELRRVLPKERGGFVNLRPKLREIGFARQHVHARLFVSSPIRLACGEYRLATPLDRAHRQCAIGDERVDIEILAVRPNYR